jgi:hypothetical protein
MLMLIIRTKQAGPAAAARRAASHLERVGAVALEVGAHAACEGGDAPATLSNQPLLLVARLRP